MDAAKQKLANALLRTPRVKDLDKNPDQTPAVKPQMVGLQEAMRKLGKALNEEDSGRAAEAFRDAFAICDGYGPDDKTTEGE